MNKVWYRGNFEFPTGDTSSPLGDDIDIAREKFYKELAEYEANQDKFGTLYGASFAEYIWREGESLADSKTLVEFTINQ